MQSLDDIAESRIREAIARGDFDALPGTGRPLTLDDDPLVPQELRVAFRILKNAGYVPPEVELRREIASVESLLVATADATGRSAALRRLELLQSRLDAVRSPTQHLAVEQQYFQRLVDKLDHR